MFSKATQLELASAGATVICPACEDVLNDGDETGFIAYKPTYHDEEETKLYGSYPAYYKGTEEGFSKFLNDWQNTGCSTFRYEVKEVKKPEEHYA